MPKKRKAAKTADSGKTRKRKSSVAPVILRLLLLVVIAGLIFWFWPRITDWVANTWELIAYWIATTWEGMLELLGIGLALIAIALGIIIWIFAQGRFSLFTKYWQWWLGGIPLALAAWGIAAFFTPGSGIVSEATLGGRFGKNIIGDSYTVGALRLAGIIFLGVLILAPRWTWHLITNIFKGIGKLFQLIWQAIRKASQRQPKVKPEPVTREVEFAKVEEKEIVPQAPSFAPPKAAEPPTPEAWEPGKYQPVLTAGGWQLPPITILDKPTEVELSQSDIEKRAQLIEEALSSYGVETKVVQINVGPTVTQFGVEPGWDRKYKEIRERDKDGNVKVRLEEVSKTRVKVDRISALASDLALALAASSIRIEAPVPGKSMVGIEVPNTTFGLVNLRSVIESTAFQKSYAKSKLALALGKGAGGETVAADLARMPHLLIAGATGSGKTACLNSIICCLLIHNTPDDVQFIMIDPKRVELVNFNTLPHLTAPVVVDTDKAILALRWLNQEMDNRYHKFAQVGARNIDGYNKNRHPGETMPFMVLVIDELADLMMAAFDEVEHTLCRLAQLARATGIHLIVATQRPSVDVVTGLIKANFPTRISFALTSQVDSRTILDSAGAEKLLGRGDMLYMPTDASKPKRLQGTFVSDAETERVVYFWSNQRRPDVAPIKFEEMSQLAAAEKGGEDSLLEAARQLAQEHKYISTSFLQRRLRIGYPRAARIMEKLEEEGYRRETIEQ
ncbi:MAG: DNA translocase FtsK [Chloroflexi bacterium]|nr:DNA translocase FtsK [Chloroflexota bacterium]MBM3174675.1 DNA translocase FtsK [Chloroflexota bacterium]